MNLSEIILVKLKQECRGIVNAVKREDLLRYCQAFEPDLTDREMRRLVKAIPKICTSEKGYYLAMSKDEADYSIAYLKKKIFPLWEDIKRTQQAYPEFYKEEQLGLF